MTDREQHIATLKAFVPVCLTAAESQAVAAAIAALEREGEMKHCNICGGRVDLTSATKPTVHIGKGRML